MLLVIDAGHTTGVFAMHAAGSGASATTPAVRPPASMWLTQQVARVARRAGICCGSIGLIERLTARIKSGFQGAAEPDTMKLEAAGGLAPLLCEATEIIERIDPEPTRDGLRLLAARHPTPRLMAA